METSVTVTVVELVTVVVAVMVAVDVLVSVEVMVSVTPGGMMVLVEVTVLGTLTVEVYAGAVWVTGVR